MRTCSYCCCLRDCSHVGAHAGARRKRQGNYPSSKASTSMSALSDSTTMRMSPAAFHSSASCALGSQHKQSVHRGREKRKKKRRSAHLTCGDLVALSLGPLDNLALGHGGGKGGHEHGGSAVGKLGTARGSSSWSRSGGSRGGSRGAADHDLGDVSPEQGEDEGRGRGRGRVWVKGYESHQNNAAATS